MCSQLSTIQNIGYRKSIPRKIHYKKIKFVYVYFKAKKAHIYTTSLNNQTLIFFVHPENLHMKKDLSERVAKVIGGRKRSI